ncbi:hypothetical protein L1987_21716 [Smallanthus sonchifolius]|uniref:Uncharacterized protein n=1 Tax=Smallanthus sonchifolius TaxID=185202 RepID=A0ACB9ICW3_9ASTR|nr:hypothetical protein L1987_21716 [Smallanthus sonchifolius]
MESSSSNRIKAIQELTNGQIVTNKLHAMLGRPEKIESDLKLENGVVVQILRMFDNTRSILRSSNLNEILHNPTSDVRSSSSWPEDFGESIEVTKNVKTKKGCYKRRKDASTIVKMTSALSDDGYAWRKYGQKVILNSKHQRNYYRCTYKFEQGCQATKQIQKIDDEPSKYKITYCGRHSCNNLQRAPQMIMESPNPGDSSILISFKTSTHFENDKVDTCFPLIKHTPKEGFSSLGHLKHEEVSSSNHHTPWDPIVGPSQVPQEPMSMMSYRLDHEGIVSPGVFSSTCSTHNYEINDMTENHDYDDFLFSWYP